MKPFSHNRRYGHSRTRLGYISSDFCQHPVPLLIAKLIESHDRNQFEVLGFSTGLNDNSSIRARIEKAFERFYDVQGRPPAMIAKLLRELEVDILVDLTGHTEGDHFEILSYRPCPIQVNYLGYPATSGATSSITFWPIQRLPLLNTSPFSARRSSSCLTAISPPAMQRCFLHRRARDGFATGRFCLFQLQQWLENHATYI